jgi:hypothetical protein
MSAVEVFNQWAFKDGSTAVTQLITDKSTKFATTEFVHNVLTGTVIELDFGLLQSGEKLFTFTHTGAVITDIIRAELAYLQPSGKSLDEVEMDSFYILGKVSAPDTITLLIRPLTGTVQNKFKFRYQIFKG